jgi:agmatine deiminase
MNTMKYITLSVIVLLYACSDKDTRLPADAFYMPAQWEPHEAIWFGWTKNSPKYYPAVAEMIKGLEGHVKIKLAVDSDSLLNVAKQTLGDFGVNISTIEFHVMPGEDYWIRDHGATFLVNGQGELAAIDFDWILYGSLDWWQLREPQPVDSIAVWKKNILKGNRSKVDSLMGVSTKAQIIKSNLVMEGGSIESNGNGVLLQSEAVTFQRNPGWTKEEIEAEYKRVMNVDKVIWLKHGLAEDEHIWHLHNGKYVTIGTGGHTDEFVRFADANTILLAWVDEEEKDKHLLNRLNFERMSENLKILEAATDQNGRPFRIIKVPLPNIIERTIVVSEEKSDSIIFRISPTSFLPEERPAIGDTLIQVSASSYLNFLVSNGVLLNATYTHHGTSVEKEAKVRGIFEEVFPGRKIVWIDALEQNWNGGGIHCSTQQEPSVKNN